MAASSRCAATYVRAGRSPRANRSCGSTRCPANRPRSTRRTSDRFPCAAVPRAGSSCWSWRTHARAGPWDGTGLREPKGPLFLVIFGAFVRSHQFGEDTRQRCHIVRPRRPHGFGLIYDYLDLALIFLVIVFYPATALGFRGNDKVFVTMVGDDFEAEHGMKPLERLDEELVAFRQKIIAEYALGPSGFISVCRKLLKISLLIH